MSLIGHVTLDELKSKLRGDSLSNGFANRFLWIFAKRARLLPLGGTLRNEDLRLEGDALRNAVTKARSLGELTRDDETSSQWCKDYEWLSGERPGIVGEVTSRLEAHAVRLSLIYALIDGSKDIRLPHLNAALAVCRYALRSAEYCFGALTGHARKILDALGNRETKEMTRTEIIGQVFNGHITAEQLNTALSELHRANRVNSRKEQTSGAPRELWAIAKQANWAN